jgi:hypothetical protein
LAVSIATPNSLYEAVEEVFEKPTYQFLVLEVLISTPERTSLWATALATLLDLGPHTLRDQSHYISQYNSSRRASTKKS